ncbi:MAG: hypothetical protein ACOX3T_06290 [Bdellovibrionota bacterium]
MQDFINLKIISTDELIEDTKVNYVFIPDPAGGIKMYPKHCNYTGIISEGTLYYQKKDSEDIDKLLIKGGVCSFIENKLEVLVDL